MKEIYGLSRTRSSEGKGEVLKRDLKEWVNCIHPNSGGGYETMWVLVIEIYDEEEKKNLRLQR